MQLAEIIEDGIRYALYDDQSDPATNLRDKEDLFPSVSEVLVWDRHGWVPFYLRPGATAHEHPDDAAHSEIRYGYVQGDSAAIIHDGTPNDGYELNVVSRILFDGYAYAVADRWTDTGFEEVDSIGGILRGEGFSDDEILREAIYNMTHHH